MSGGEDTRTGDFMNPGIYRGGEYEGDRDRDRERDRRLVCPP